MAVNIQHHAILQGTADRLEELIPLCRPRGPLSGCDPALMGDVTRKAKALRTSLATFRAALDDPKHQPRSKTEEAEPARQPKLSMRLAFQPNLAELARYVSYGGKREQEFWDWYREMCHRYGQERMSAAYNEMCEPDTARLPAVIRLKPEARKACHQLLGPAPEDAGYADYYRVNRRTPPAEHQPPPTIEEPEAGPISGWER
jgi:hypothetical protein